MTQAPDTSLRPRTALQTGADGQPRLHLRILETTDVHANLLAFDYFANRPVEDYGLARTATLIRQARAENANCLLFDNGDFLQGTPVSDLTAAPGSGWTGPHPVIAAMNHLGYDAAGLGNHEFNFGLDWLQEVLGQARFPITCANIARLSADQAATPLCAPWLLLPQRLTDESGGAHELTIGVFGLVPPQITTWDRFHLNGRVESHDMVDTARQLAPQLRADGADLVIALAHTGLDTGAARPMMENAACTLARVPGIDAVLAGHNHQTYPETPTDTAPALVMAGSRGAHLGVLDLELTRDHGGWHVTRSRAEARPVARTGAPATPPDPGLNRLLAPVHARTLTLTQEPLGRTPIPLHSYLALAANSAAIQLVTRAQRLAVEAALQTGPDSGIPVLAASAAFKTGGRGGPRHYTDVPPGPLCLRHTADLYSFPNHLSALRMTGAGLRDWLERAAIVFNTIRPGRSGQMLCNADVPGHDFDVIDGLSYTIDLGTGPGRIRNLTHAGRAVRDDDRFILATNSYRAAGGGPYPMARPEQIAHTDTRAIRDILAQSLRDGTVAPAAAAPVWHFAPMPGTRALLTTGPGLRYYAEEITRLGACDLGEDDSGFLRLSLPL